MSTATAPAKPSYLGLLNAISLAEANAGVLLDAWAEATPNVDLAACLRFVAHRETSHGEVFRRRIQELGFDVLKRDDPKFPERLARVSDPAVSDVEKLGRQEEEDAADPFMRIEGDLERGIFDPLTGLLMRWYIAEERDSGTRLREVYASVRSAG